jgi:hypothetical protein
VSRRASEIPCFAVCAGAASGVYNDYGISRVRVAKIQKFSLLGFLMETFSFYPPSPNLKTFV